jgi:putative membrane protein
MTRRSQESSDLVQSLVVGAAAGVAAAAVTSLFQSAWSNARLPPTDEKPQAIPPTETLAERLCEATTGSPLRASDRKAAGMAVHYAVGAGLGAVYALILRRWPATAADSGIAYGLCVWATVEEIGLSLFRLKPAPWKVELAEHLFAASSHVVFGLALDASLAAVQGLHSKPGLGRA